MLILSDWLRWFSSPSPPIAASLATGNRPKGLFREHVKHRFSGGGKKKRRTALQFMEGLDDAVRQDSHGSHALDAFEKLERA
jgi:hypothetical protein